MNTLDIDKIRKYYEEKKRKFANGYTYYVPKTKWGDKYGYELKPPYTPEEVNSWRKILPNDFYTYLTKISREVFVDVYPYVITKESFEEIYDDVVIDENDLKEIEDEKIRLKCVKVGEGGCTFYNFMNIETGRVFYVCGDDDHQYLNALKIANTFSNYVIEPINKIMICCHKIGCGLARGNSLT